MDAGYTGGQIMERRKSLGLTQKALAQRLHVTDKAVSKWERGINFPDLGLIERLAQELQTTPAVLLGLEEAAKEEVLSSVVEISARQEEDARRDICITGWLGLAAAALLILASLLYGNDVRRTQYAYYILYSVMAAMAAGAWLLLRKYGQLREFQVADLGISMLVIIPLFSLLMIQWISGRNPAAALLWLLLLTIGAAIQWLMYRLLVPRWAKALPLILMTGYALWKGLNGFLHPDFLMPLIGCVAAYAGCVLWEKRKQKR